MSGASSQTEGAQGKGIPFSDLIHQIRTSGIPNVDGMQSIDSTPPSEDQMFIDGTGHIVHGFDHKFTPDFSGWKPGDRIRTRFIVSLTSPDDPNKLELLVADSVTGDIRHSDIFVIEDLRPEDAQALTNLGVAELDANIEVSSDGEYKVSDMFSHTAKLYEINGIQATFDGDFSRLESGQQTLVEGKVIEYVGKAQYPKSDMGSITIELPNGERVNITLFNGNLAFESGSLEIINPDNPLEGDSIQVNSRFGNPKGKYGEDLPDQLYAFFCRSTHLVTPSETRLANNMAQREAVAHELDAMANLVDHQELKTRLSHLIKTNLYAKNTFMRIALTADELKRTRALLETKFPDSTERPLDLFDDIYTAEEINRVYGVDIYAMSPKEFYDFCMQMASGKKSAIYKGSVDYPYRIMQDRLSLEQQETILQTAVNSLQSLVIGKKVIHRQDILVDPTDIPDLETKGQGQWESRSGGPLMAVFESDYDSDEITNPDNVTWDKKYLFDQSLKYLSRHITGPTAQVYIDLVRRVDQEDLFMQDHNHRLEFPVYEIFSAIAENVDGLFKQHNALSRQTGIPVYLDGLYRYVGELSRLRGLSSKIKERGWNNEGRYDQTQEIDKVINMLDQFDAHTSQSRASLN